MIIINHAVLHASSLLLFLACISDVKRFYAFIVMPYITHTLPCRTAEVIAVRGKVVGSNLAARYALSYLGSLRILYNVCRWLTSSGDTGTGKLVTIRPHGRPTARTKNGVKITSLNKLFCVTFLFLFS